MEATRLEVARPGIARLAAAPRGRASEAACLEGARLEGAYLEAACLAGARLRSAERALRAADAEGPLPGERSNRRGASSVKHSLAPRGSNWVVLAPIRTI
ncbi:pentapeptide repeat-containing protein [Actinoplanes sp. NPDC049316]|uniref:pentapeptide repeat-containing protein n=1 Tax=Actinoplanes sp. NPDC049316 TaxID=3154727 RepID=UPI003424709F